MKSKRVFVVLYSHIDVGWGYYWGPTLEHIQRQNNVIVFSALNLIRSDPDFKWILDNTYTLQRFYRDFPELREVVRSAYREGRLEIAPPAIAISPLYIDGESFIRNILLGKEFFREILGRDVKTNVFAAFDVTCHHPQLPQILNKLGFRYYIPGRPGKEVYKEKGIPVEFIWEGLDGSRVFCNRFSYGRGYVDLEKILGRSTWKVGARNAVEQMRKSIKEAYGDIEPPYLVCIGRDWHLFHPALCDLIRFWNSLGEEEVTIATLSDYFKHLPRKGLKVVRGDIDPVSWAAIYGVGGDMVRYKIISAVNALLNSEKICSIISLYGRSYPLRRFKKAWYLVCISWHHDMSHGYVSHPDYEKWTRILDNIRRWALDQARHSLRYLASKVDTSWSKGTPVLVFNTLPWRRMDKVFVETIIPDRCTIEVYDSEGDRIPSQVEVLKKLSRGKRLVRVHFLADVPSLGYSTYDLRIEEEYREHSTMSDKILENDYFRLEFERGCISSIYDKRTECNILDTSEYLGNDIVVQNVKFRPPNGLAIDEVVSEFKSSDNGVDEESIMRGELMSMYKSHTIFKGIDLSREVVLHNYKPMIEFRTMIKDEAYDHRIRAIFPLSFKGRVFRSIPFGVVEFKAEEEPYLGWERSYGNLPGVFWASNWVDYSSNSYGVILANRGRIGYQVEENKLSVILLATRDPAVLSRFAYPHLIGTGMFSFNYVLIPHTESWKDSKSYVLVEEWLNPLMAIVVDKHEGVMPSEKSFMSISGEGGILLSSIYRSNSRIYLRMYEIEGRESSVELVVDKPPKRILETDMLGEVLGESSMRITLKPYEIKTLALEF